jgi:large subunit ribosomal protein L10Ae
MGPTLNKIGMFPQVITHKDPLKDKISELKTTVKFQLKKVLCIHVAIGHAELDKD